jgi:hypothetical protein
MADDKLIVGLSADIKGLRDELNKANGLLNNFGKEAGKSINQTSNSFNSLGQTASKLGGILAGAFAVGSIASFGSKIVQTTAEFQRFEAVLSNTLGSNSAAQIAMQQINEFASATPFAVDELTNAFVKLANQGFQPTIEEMRSLGDLASSTGKSFNQLAEALLDAQVGEFERLKEFGIKARVEGDKVMFTFKGVETQVNKSSSAIKDYILSLGNAEGVTGAMAKISATLGGQLSNLGDNWTTLMKTFGDANTGVLSATIGKLNDLLGALNKIGTADNITLKLGIDQRGINFADNVPFAELQNLWGGITGGQSANMVLAESYQQLGEQIAKSKTKKELKDLIAVLTNTRNQLEQGSPQWVIYNQRIIDAAAALNQWTAAQKKEQAGKITPITDSIGALESKLKDLTEQYKNVKAGSAEFIRLGKEIDNVKAKLQAIQDAKVAPLIKFETPSLDAQLATADIDLSALQDAIKPISDFQAQTNMLNGSLKELAAIGGQAFTPIQMALDNTKLKSEEVNVSLGNIITVLGQGLTGAFEAAISGTESFGDAFAKMIKQLIARLLAAIAAAAALAVIISIASGGANLAATLKSLGISGGKTGFASLLNLTSGGLLGGSAGSRVASAVGTGTNQGNVSFEIRGDKLYGVLQNYQSRLDRLQ